MHFLKYKKLNALSDTGEKPGFNIPRLFPTLQSFRENVARSNADGPYQRVGDRLPLRLYDRNRWLQSRVLGVGQEHALAEVHDPAKGGEKDVARRGRRRVSGSENHL